MAEKTTNGESPNTQQALPTTDPAVKSEQVAAQPEHFATNNAVSAKARYVASARMQGTARLAFAPEIPRIPTDKSSTHQ